MATGRIGGENAAFSQSNGTPKARASYDKPALKVFGSVQLLTQGSGPVNGDGGQGMMHASMSDPALKQNIVQIARHARGFGLYVYEFKPEYQAACGKGRQFGVMADEVRRVVPAAVHMGADGYMRVDYRQLGICIGS